MKGKKGLSAVVTTLIIVLLAIVALSVVWSVITNVTDNAQERTELGQKCLPIDISATKISDVNGDGLTYSLTLSRTGAGTNDGVGVKVAFFNDTANSNTYDFGIALNPLDTKTNSSLALSAEDVVIGANKVEITPYFVDEAGGEDFCSTTTKSF